MISKNQKTKLNGKNGISSFSWLFIALTIGLIALVAIAIVPKFFSAKDTEKFTPTRRLPDPSDHIEGVKKIYYQPGVRIRDDQRVAYDQSPPFGGPHTKAWATCMGNIYPLPIRNENAVHSLHNGAIWITYNPKTLSRTDLELLKTKVRNQPYIFLSPYPNLSSKISLQSWGHQLKLDDPQDKRIDHFITALKQNRFVGVYKGYPNDSAYPSVGASCGVTKGFNPQKPNLFNYQPLPPHSIGMDGVEKK